MIQRLASVLLITVLVSASGLGRFAGMTLNRRSLRQRELVGDLERKLAEPDRQHGAVPASSRLVDERRHAPRVSVAPADIAHAGIRVGAGLALVAQREDGFAPERPIQTVLFAANSRPAQQQPPVILAARAPPA